ncbi:DUF427 domain-containing protein [Lichenifustis flavocetrariae]|uniref:DUF427 domain-containing protein n=1 Tax=Lichenifustis flavocetrariae TaxID=2949735 RepID=A0AA41Z427_9HYPH|nr:DUF427 domain-containing protein [Lichenifustis flavocetrariae]MCW6508877.1 DUF427 domain-containing protein [Lichenifustis flavocetrariae]
MNKLIKVPGPDHPITIEPTPERVRISWRGQVLADTGDALTLREARYPVVYYLPRKDVDMARLTRSAHQTYCPFKGDCSYFDLPANDGSGANAVWSYEAPFDAVAAIKDHLAFYSDRVEIELASQEQPGRSTAGNSQ